jgi:hypothetical protein
MRDRIYGVITLSAGSLLLTTGYVLWSMRGRASQSLRNQAVAEIAESIVRNYESVPKLTFQTNTIIENAPVTKDETIVTTDGKGGLSEVRIAPRRSYGHLFVLDGQNLRRDYGSSKDREIIVRRDLQLQYLPDIQRAWLRHAVDWEAHPFDPRCWGFRPPLARVSEWFSTVSVISVQDIGLDLSTRRIAAMTSEGERVEVSFSRVYSYLPISVEYKHTQDDSCAWLAEIAYKVIDGTNAFFPERVVVRTFARGITAESDSNAWLTRSTMNVTSLSAQPKWNPSTTFDPILPRGTLVTKPSGRNVRLDSDEKVFEKAATLTSEKPLRSARPTRHSWWLIVGCIDLLFAAGLYRNRVRLGL